MIEYIHPKLIKDMWDKIIYYDNTPKDLFDGWQVVKTFIWSMDKLLDWYWVNKWLKDYEWFNERKFFNL